MTRRVVLILGAPGSGKTTYARKTGLRVLDRDEYDTDTLFLADVRQACSEPDAQVAVIRTGATKAAQDDIRAHSSPTEVVVMDTPEAECIRRVQERGRDVESEVEAVRAWFRNNKTGGTTMTLNQYETREASFPLEVRNAETLDSEERVMTLLLVPYGEVSHLTKYPKGERFLKGSFRKAASEFRGRRTPLYLFRAHQHDRAVGKAVNLRDTTEGPVAEFRIAKTPAGDEVIEEYREGLLSAVSVGFRAVQDGINRVDGVREVREAALLETSVLPIGAYDGARVLEYREPEAIDLSAYMPPPAPKINPTLPWGRR